MNFVGHIHLARRYRAEADGAATSDLAPIDEDGFLLGAALPDLAAMGRFRLDGPAGDPAVRAGVAVHHRSDDVFHRHPWFRTNARAVTEQLERAGVSRGAARACGHVGVELLLDGRLLTTADDLAIAAGRALAAGAGGELGLDQVVAADRRTAWRRHLERLAGWDLPDDYHRPAAVAARLERILARRPRLRLDPADVPAVADALTTRWPAVEAGAGPLMDDLTAELTSAP